MSERYIIKRIEEGCLDLEHNPEVLGKLPEPYCSLNVAEIMYPWHTNEADYSPRACARVGWNEAGLHVLLTADEFPIMAETKEMGGPVYTNSCLEFFFMPFPGTDERYMNVEMNPLGIMLIGQGEGRHGRVNPDSLPLPGMNVSTTVRDEKTYNHPSWAVSYTIPMDQIERFFGARLSAGSVFRGNFYKCAEKVEHPHFGMWNEIKVAKPDFHRPEFFGELVLE